MDGFKDSTKMKYMDGGMVAGYGKGGDAKMPSPAESAASGNRMSAQEGAERREMMKREMMKRDMKKRVPATRREPMLPPIADSVASGNRVSKMEGREARALGVYKKGGLASKR